jgi:phospholipid/cholesterol/gamma-HCH transport system substrate-binding protein
MRRTRTQIQLLAFLLITVLAVAYAGVTYIGVNPLRRPYTVYLHLPAAGGIFANADVAERGVVVGKVGSVSISPDRSGVVAALKINHGVRIPRAGLTATVTDLSAVGEQYVELEPATSLPPYVQPGTFLPSTGAVPVDDATLLLNLKTLLTSVPTKDLSVVIRQLGQGFNGLGPTLQRLIDNNTALTQSAINALPATRKLINSGRTVLDTQNDVAGELKAFAASLSNVTGQVRASDPALRGVLDNGAEASKQLDTLLQANESVLPALLANLNTFTAIQDVRLPQTRTVLELFPGIVGDAFYALPKPGADGLTTARFGQVTDANDYCTTGYSSTKVRPNTASGWGGAGNLDAYCHGNNRKLDSQGVDIRGYRNAPKPKGDHANVTNSDPNPAPAYPGRFPGAGKVSASADVVIPSQYNPHTGMVQGINGKLYQLGLNGPVAPVFGSSSYRWLLIAPTMR